AAGVNTSVALPLPLCFARAVPLARITGVAPAPAGSYAPNDAVHALLQLKWTEIPCVSATPSGLDFPSLKENLGGGGGAAPVVNVWSGPVTIVPSGSVTTS